MPEPQTPRLPLKPNLAQDRKRAKDLLKALRRSDPAAVARFRSHHPRFVETMRDVVRAAGMQLSDAQLVVAREYGFASWPALKAHIEWISGRVAERSSPHSVLMWNDDTTPMEFVVDLLRSVFQKSAEDAC